MRTREEIRQQLLEDLSSSTWQKVKNSLVGKEWLALAVETIYQAEEQNNLLHSAFDYKTATKEQLISMSHTYDIAVSFNRPDTITLRLSTPNMSIKPFSLSLRVGNVTYYNIEATSSDYDIVLYQGVAHIGENVPPQLSTIYTKTSNTIDGYSVGDIIPSSVYCYKSGGQQIGRFTTLNSSPSNELFKIYTKSNGTQFVVQGDGVWGKATTIATYDYLMPTHNLVDTDNGSVYYESVVYSGGFSILSTTNGKEDDLDYAREQYYRYYLERNAIVSKKQIVNYVNSFPDVLDCDVDRISGVNHVYVKPTDANSNALTFDNIKMSLLLNAELGASYLLRYGAHVVFAFVVENISAQNRTAVTNYITSKYAYNKIKYAEELNISKLTNEITTLVGETPTIRVKVKYDTLTNNALSASPNRGSVEVYYNNNRVAIDSNGSLVRVDQTSGTTSMTGVHDNTIGSIVCINSATAENNAYYYDKSSTKIFNLHIDRPNFSGAFTFGDRAYASVDGATHTTIYEYYSDDINLYTAISNSIEYARSIVINDTSITAGVDLIFSDESGYKVLHNQGTKVGQMSFYNNSGNEVYTHGVDSASSSNLMMSIALTNNNYYVLMQNGSVCILRNLNTSVETYPVYNLDMSGVFNGFSPKHLCHTKSGKMLIVCADTNGVYKVAEFDNFNTDSTTNTLYFTNLSVLGSMTYSGSALTITSGADYIDLNASANNYRFYSGDATAYNTSGLQTVDQSQVTSIGHVSYRRKSVYMDDNRSYTYTYECDTLGQLAIDRYLVLDTNNSVIYQ